MFNFSMTLLNCAECNGEKFEAHGWSHPKYLETAVCRKLDFRICKIILTLSYSKKQYWSGSSWEGISKKLKVELSKLLNNTAMERTEEEHLAELVRGIKYGISYLKGIKEAVKVKTFQHIEKYLCELQRQTGQISETIRISWEHAKLKQQLEVKA